MDWYVMKFVPLFKERIWGSRRLQEVFGKDLPGGQKIGESWELADLPNDKSVIANGVFAGRTLASVVSERPREIMGPTGRPAAFPLLIKFLDAADILSVQVHPDAEACQRMAKGELKTECWYIVAADPGAFIYKGLQPGVTKQRFARAVAAGSVEPLLAKVPVEAGQCHHLPAGTVHALGPGLLVAEIQTPSDTTYRVFDWNRVDDMGRPRTLHIQEALESIHFGEDLSALAVTTVGRLVDCPYFHVDKGHRGTGSETLLSPGVMKVLVIINGGGRIVDAAGGATEFGPGDCLLVPAAYEGVMQTQGNTEYLTVTL
jgi:mannose-6-phosphate isomerase